MKKILSIAFLIPTQVFAFNFCRVDLMSGTIERKVTAVCDGTVLLEQGAGRSNLGFGLFTQAMSDVLKQDPGLRVLSCEGTDYSTCYLVKK